MAALSTHTDCNRWIECLKKEQWSDEEADRRLAPITSSNHAVQFLLRTCPHTLRSASAGSAVRLGSASASSRPPSSTASVGAMRRPRSQSSSALQAAGYSLGGDDAGRAPQEPSQRLGRQSRSFDTWTWGDGFGTNTMKGPTPLPGERLCRSPAKAPLGKQVKCNQLPKWNATSQMFGQRCLAPMM
mmetsp:Transcript_134556/g.287902  ORF Transcript_134556/g.287902 Transcript_134556/m.287902 type:complete len:186 (-) Transcript_134556:74-631(-)